MIAGRGRLEIDAVTRSFFDQLRLFERHVLGAGSHHAVTVRLRFRERFLDLIVIALGFGKGFHIAHQAEIVRDALPAFLAQHLVEKSFLGVNAKFRLAFAEFHGDIVGIDKLVVLSEEIFERQAVLHLHERGRRLFELRQDGGYRLAAFGQGLYPLGKFDVDARHGELEEHFLHNFEDLLLGELLGVDGEHGNSVLILQRRAERFLRFGLTAVEENDERLADLFELGGGVFLRRDVSGTGNVRNAAVRRHEDADGGMFPDDLFRSQLRRFFKGHGLIAPRRLDKAGRAVLFETARALYGKAYAVHQTDGRLSALPNGDLRSLRRNEFRLRRHHRAPRRGLRQFVRHHRPRRIFGGGNDKLFHEPFDKGGFSRPYRSHHTDVNIAVRTACNVFVNAVIFHTDLQPCFAAPCVFAKNLRFQTLRFNICGDTSVYEAILSAFFYFVQKPPFQLLGSSFSKPNPSFREASSMVR